MKILFTILASVLIVSTGYSQIVELTNEENLVYGNSANEGEELGVAWNVTNATSSALDIKCKRVATTEVPGAASQFCWGILCSPWNTGTTTLNEVVTLDPGQTSGSFYAKYRHYGNAGDGVYSYCFFNANDPTQEFCYEVTYSVELGVNVAETTKMQGEITAVTPNPVIGKGVISYQFTGNPSDGSLIIYNMLGSVVKKVKLTNKQGVVMIDGNEFENGIYFCAIQNEGKVFQTSRIVVSH